MLVRDASLADRDALVAVRAGGAYDRYLAEAAAGDAAFLVAESRGELAGFALVYLVTARKSHVPKLSDVYVAASHRRCRIATALVEACEARARGSGFVEIFVSVEPANDPMLRLVATRGYETLTAEPYRTITPEGVAYDRLDLRRFLASG